MGALVAIGSILTLLFAKHQLAAASVPATASGTAGAKITGAPDQDKAFDPNAPAQADAIGNTHLSTFDPFYTAGGDLVSQPYRPSDLEYGGGVASAIGIEGDEEVMGTNG